MPFKTACQLTKQLIQRYSSLLFPLSLAAGCLLAAALVYKNISDNTGLADSLAAQGKIFAGQKAFLSKKLVTAQQALQSLKNQDQYKINQQLEAEIKSIEDTYQKSVTVYEKLLDLKTKQARTVKLDESYASIIKLLSERRYASASSALAVLEKQIQDENDKLVNSFKIPENLSVENAPPVNGYRRQQVQTEGSSFMVDIVSASLSSTRVIVDTASDSDCANDCPVLSLADYASRNGAFAGINGSYFCPATYPSCANKKNSYDTLLMNKNKKYFNSDNNVYSTVPAVIFQGSSIRFISQSLEWGRDTSIDSMIANYPLLLLGGSIVYGGDGDPKHASKGGRSFVGSTGGIVYIGVVHNATLAESAKVLKTLGIGDVLNLDNGGSTALWYGGYKAGPGRNLPNAILLVRK